jgi:hypothetical protein
MLDLETDETYAAECSAVIKKLNELDSQISPQAMADMLCYVLASMVNEGVVDENTINRAIKEHLACNFTENRKAVQ